MVIESWPDCQECGQKMPWLASNRRLDVHVCDQCQKLVLKIKRTGELSWYGAIFSNRELTAMVKNMLPRRHV